MGSWTEDPLILPLTGTLQQHTKHSEWSRPALTQHCTLHNHTTIIHLLYCIHSSINVKPQGRGGTYQGILTEVWLVIQGVLTGVWLVIQGILTGVWLVIQGILTGVWLVIQGIRTGVWLVIQGILTGVWLVIQGVLTGVWLVIPGGSGRGLTGHRGF